MVEHEGKRSGRLDRKLWPVFSICLLTYFFSARGYIEVSDTHFSLQTAQAIVTRGELNIPYAEAATLEGPNGKSYSKYGVGLAAFYVPLVAVAEALSKVTHFSSQGLAAFLISFASIPFAIVVLVVFARLLRCFDVAKGQDAVLLLGLGLGTLMWRYACSDYSEMMQMAALTLAVYCVIRRTTASLVTGGFAFAWLILVKLVYVALLPILVVYLFSRTGDWRERLQRTVWFSLPLAPAMGLILWLNLVRFGSMFESGYSGEAGLFFPDQLWWTVPQLLGSLEKGLFIYSPILILGLFGWRAFVRQHRAEAILCLALILANLSLGAAWHSWQGGWAWGPRWLVPAIPLWLLPAAFSFPQWAPRKRTLLLAAAVAASTLLQVPGILVYDNEFHYLKEAVLTPDEQPSAASDYLAAWILVRHKLMVGDEVYRISEFHVASDRTVDLSGFKGFAGWDIWTEQLARQLHKPVLRGGPICGLFAVAFLLFRLGRHLAARWAEPDT